MYIIMNNLSMLIRCCTYIQFKLYVLIGPPRKKKKFKYSMRKEILKSLI